MGGWGFTGTQEGMTELQKEKVKSLLLQGKPEALHHGDCFGADAQTDRIARELSIRVEIHPPTDPRKRAFCPAPPFTESFDVVHPAKPYLDRNKDIVDASTILIAAPKTAQEELRSGTWSTVRYARRKGIRVIIVNPDGTFA